LAVGGAGLHIENVDLDTENDGFGGGGEMMEESDDEDGPAH
jgi:hypothetical protein